MASQSCLSGPKPRDASIPCLKNLRVYRGMEKCYGVLAQMTGPRDHLICGEADMHQEKNRVFLIVLILFLLFPVSNLFGTDAPQTILIDNKGYVSKKKGPVAFNHQAHAEDYGATCDDCHHVYKNGKNIWEEGDEVEKCSQCHDPRLSRGNVKKLQIAFHDSCKTCHKESGSEQAPYKRCYGCHKKK
jgi:hypothetical protein